MEVRTPRALEKIRNDQKVMDPKGDNFQHTQEKNKKQDTQEPVGYAITSLMK